MHGLIAVADGRSSWTIDQKIDSLYHFATCCRIHRVLAPVRRSGPFTIVKASPGES